MRRRRDLTLSVLALVFGVLLSSTLLTTSTRAAPDDADQVLLVEPNGRWHIRVPDPAAPTTTTSIPTGNPDYTFWYGMAGDVPLLGDWDGDGYDTPGMYRPSNGFAYLTNDLPPNGGVGFGDASLTFFFGVPGDQVFVGDWNDDGIDTLGINRGGRIFLSNTNATTFADQDFWFGTPTDQAFGGNSDDIAGDSVFLYRPATGFVYYSLFNPTGSGAVASTEGEFFFGLPGDRLVIGDWDGNGTDTAGIFRPSNRLISLRNTLDTGLGEGFFWGESDWLPVAGRINLPTPVTYELRIVGPLGFDAYPGLVTSDPPGIECANSLSASDCSQEYPAGTQVILTAAMEDAPVRFVEWIGGDCGSANPCTVTVSADVSLSPVWEWWPLRYNLEVIPSEGGTVTSDPGGIANCSLSNSDGCSSEFTTGSWVTVTPTPDVGYEFSGWSDAACLEFTGSCTVLIVEDRFVSPTFQPSLPIRVNAGGPQIQTSDGPPWLEDTTANPSPFVNFTSSDAQNTTASWPGSPLRLDSSVPLGTPYDLFTSERYDNAGGPNMHWNFPVEVDRDLVVRLYFSSGYSGASNIGERLFDVTIDGRLVLDDYDMVADVGHQVGAMKSFRVTGDTDGLDIVLTHLNPAVQNPLVNGIEVTQPTLNSVSFIEDAAVVMEYDSVYDVHSSTHGSFYTDIILDDLTQWIEPDQYNFVLLYPVQDVPGGLSSGSRGIWTPAKNIGLPNDYYGEGSRFPDWPKLYAAPHMKFFPGGHVFSMHEMGHEWGVFWVGPETPAPHFWQPEDPVAWLAATPGHWTDPGMRWLDDGEPGILSSTPTGTFNAFKFNAFDLYAMGLMGYEEAREYTYNIADNNRDVHVFTVDDLIHSLSVRGTEYYEGAGRRIPDTDLTVEDLRTLIVVVKGAGETLAPSAGASIVELAEGLPGAWFFATWERSSMSVGVDRVPLLGGLSPSMPPVSGRYHGLVSPEPASTIP